MLKVLFAALLLAPAAHASVYFEPYGGYTAGSIGAIPNTGTATSSGIQGAAYGARLGYQFMDTVFLAYDFQGMAATEYQTGASSTYSWGQSTPFATLGIQFPVGLRILGGYSWSTTATEGTSPNATVFTGTATKFGLGWLFARTIAINVEYSIYAMKNKSVAGANTDIPNNYSQFAYSAGMISLSIPLTLFDMGDASAGEHVPTSSSRSNRTTN